ncbi:hypothetical protein EX30DRAFT_63838 [Ascodesmis nigricans]|uniref:Uncharacterized protein n=1 Tax=Ascodesmis nigricans TaxID=341454 RepID=A0A4S2MUL1_9PEZI|nr:hypothetical protein EX30DRAFT_63838 [Ascodesmis nigricans]
MSTFSARRYLAVEKTYSTHYPYCAGIPLRSSTFQANDPPSVTVTKRLAILILFPIPLLPRHNPILDPHLYLLPTACTFFLPDLPTRSLFPFSLFSSPPHLDPPCIKHKPIFLQTPSTWPQPRVAIFTKRVADWGSIGNCCFSCLRTDTVVGACNYFYYLRGGSDVDVDVDVDAEGGSEVMARHSGYMLVGQRLFDGGQHQPDVITICRALFYSNLFLPRRSHTLILRPNRVPALTAGENKRAGHRNLSRMTGT